MYASLGAERSLWLADRTYEIHDAEILPTTLTGNCGTIRFKLRRNAPMEAFHHKPARYDATVSIYNETAHIIKTNMGMDLYRQQRTNKSVKVRVLQLKQQLEHMMRHPLFEWELGLRIEVRMHRVDNFNAGLSHARLISEAILLTPNLLRIHFLPMGMFVDRALVLFMHGHANGYGAQRNEDAASPAAVKWLNALHIVRIRNDFA